MTKRYIISILNNKPELIKSSDYFLLYIVLLLILFTLGSCGAAQTIYNHNTDSINNVQPAVLFIDKNIAVISIDGINTNYSSSMLSDKYHYRVRIAPGTHVLTLKYKSSIPRGVEWCDPMEMNVKLRNDCYYKIYQTSGNEYCHFKISTGGPTQ